MGLFEPTEKTAGQIHILLLVPDGTTISNSERMTIRNDLDKLEKELWATH